MSAVLMLITLLTSAILAMDGFKKYAIYTAILSLVCGIFGIVMGDIVAGLADKVDLVTSYPSLIDNPASITKLHMLFNTLRFAQFGVMALVIIANIIIITKVATKATNNA